MGGDESFRSPDMALFVAHLTFTTANGSELEKDTVTNVRCQNIVGVPESCNFLKAQREHTAGSFSAVVTECDKFVQDRAFVDAGGFEGQSLKRRVEAQTLACRDGRTADLQCV